MKYSGPAIHNIQVTYNAATRDCNIENIDSFSDQIQISNFSRLSKSTISIDMAIPTFDILSIRLSPLAPVDVCVSVFKCKRLKRVHSSRLNTVDHACSLYYHVVNCNVSKRKPEQNPDKQQHKNNTSEKPNEHHLPPVSI